MASATAVTTVGAVVGVATGGAPTADANNFEATAADTTLLADIPAGQQAQVQTASLTQQADAQASAAEAAAKTSAEESARIQAAKDAKAKKQAAEDKLEKERQEKKDKADAADPLNGSWRAMTNGSSSRWLICSDIGPTPNRAT